MRLIDADTIVTALLYDEEHEQTNEVKMTIGDFLDGHTVEGCPQSNGWISVMDKQPDDASDVLAYYQDAAESRIIPVNYYKGVWYDCVFNKVLDDAQRGFISHWMSLPKSPKEDNNADK